MNILEQTFHLVCKFWVNGTITLFHNGIPFSSQGMPLFVRKKVLKGLVSMNF
jgi:hypothetical protein